MHMQLCWVNEFSTINCDVISNMVNNFWKILNIDKILCIIHIPYPFFSNMFLYFLFTRVLFLSEILSD